MDFTMKKREGSSKEKEDVLNQLGEKVSADSTDESTDVEESSIDLADEVRERPQLELPYFYRATNILSAPVKNTSSTDDSVKPLDLKLDHSEYHLPTTVKIKIKNVVSSFRLGCVIDLNYTAEHCMNVEYRSGQNFLRIRLRKPHVMATIWHTGSASLMGACTPEQSHVGARRVARLIQKMGYEVRMHSFRVVNVVSSFLMPFEIDVNRFSVDYIDPICQRDEQLCAVYNLLTPKSTFFIHKTGSGTATATSVDALNSAYQKFYSLIYPYSIQRSYEKVKVLKQKQRRGEEKQFMAQATKMGQYNLDFFKSMTRLDKD